MSRLVILLFLLAAASPPASGLPELRIAGSSTVFPIANEWAHQMSSQYSITLEGGGSSSGARRVCAPRDDPTHVDIGDMSRDWKEGKEAVRLDDGYTLECKASGIRVTQIEVGVDGLAVAVAKNSAGHNCLTNPDVRGVTLAQLRWIYSDKSNDELADEGVDIASVVPADDGDGIKEWSDLHQACPEVPINPYGAGDQSGTHDFFGEVVLDKKKFGDTEYFPSCSLDEIQALEHMNSTEADTYIATQRPPNCYMPSEDDHLILQWTLADVGGIAFFGFAYYSIYSADLTVAQIASDKVFGTRDTTDAMIAPTSYTITDGSYTVFRRTLFMNVNNEAWPLVQAYLEYGFSDQGQVGVNSVGYVRVNTALRAKMIQRIVEAGNDEADYMPMEPEICWNGTRLSAAPYVNQFGNDKIAYSCEPCQTGRFKNDNMPAECRPCASGRFTSEIGKSLCELCEAGSAAPEGSSTCSKCLPGKVAQARGFSSCMNCIAGSVSWESGAVRCEVCGPGQFAPQGSVACSNCSVNTMAASSRSGECAVCGEGTYAAATGSSRCDRCEAGKFRVAGSPGLCLSCPEGMTTAFMAATDPMDCKCDEGSYHAPGGRVSGPCLPCPEGMTCPFGSEYDNIALWKSESRPAGVPSSDKVFPTAAEGYMTLIEDPMRVYACGFASHCPGGVPGTCADFRDTTKVACGDCMKGAYEGDNQCKECEAVDVMPFATTVGFAVCGVIFMTVVINRDVLLQSRAQLMIVVLMSLTATSIQTMGVFKALSIIWFDPLKTAMDVLSVLSFDFHIVRLGCLPLSSNPVNSFFFRQTIAPLGIPVVAGTLFAKKRLRPGTNVFVELVNTVGTLYQVFFMSIVVSATKPFICYPHPNDGGSSMVENASILCFEDPEHSAFVAIGIVSLFVVPVPFLSLIAYGILNYPSLIRSGTEAVGNVQWHSFRFMYVRFVPWRYYYSIVLLLRGLTMCLVPVVIRGDVGLQTFVMGIVLSVGIVVQQVLLPWRTKSANLLDAILNIGVLMLLFLGALVSDVSASMESVRIMGSIIVSIYVVLVVIGLSVGVYLHLQPTPHYKVFICHHRTHAAAQVRLLKILLQQRSVGKVFTDSEDLKELDTLFDTVKFKVQHLIVYLTRMALTRPWCAGEICTALHMGRAKVTAVWTPGFEPPTDEQLRNIGAFLDQSGVKLAQFGMTLGQIADALRRVCSPPTNRISLDVNLPSSTRFVALADELAGRPGKYSDTLTPITIKAGMLAISADSLDDEAVAAASVLAVQVCAQGADLMSVALTDHAITEEEIITTASAACAVVFVCSKGTLGNEAQLLMMTMAMSNIAKGDNLGASVIPVYIPGFLFPDEAFFKSLRDGSVLLFRDITVAEGYICAFFQRVLISFPVDASDAIISVQAQEVVSEVNKVQNKPRLSTEDSSPSGSKFAGSEAYGFVMTGQQTTQTTL